MTPQRLADALETLADGPPWDTAWLRSLLPELAVRGRLVRQEEGDGDARTLLLVVGHDRKERVARGELREERRTFVENAPPISTSRRKGWVSAGLGSIAHIEMGQSPKSDTYNTTGVGLPFFQGKAEFGDDHPEAVQWCSLPNKIAEVGDVLVSVRAPVGPTNLANARCCVGRGLAAVRPLAGMPPRFLRLLIQAGEPQLVAAATGTTFVAIGRDDLFNLVCELPPLAEQHRIVAKVDELMGHAAVLEERHLAASSARVRLRDAALHALAEAEDHEAVETAWQRVEEHFEDLFTEPEDIQPLRQTILQLAIRGRLVRQEEGDATRPQGSSAKQDPSAPLPFGIPPRWAIGLLQDVATSRLGKMLDKTKNRGQQVPYLRNTNIHWFEVRLDDLKQMRIEPRELDEYRVLAEDVLVCEGGHGIGRAAVWTGGLDYVAFQKALHRIRPHSGNSGRFIAYCIAVYHESGFLSTFYTGSGIPHLTGRSLAMIPFPIPPLAEQHRIVAKVDELMALCDTFEASLTQAKAVREQFAASISDAIGEASLPIPTIGSRG